MLVLFIFHCMTVSVTAFTSIVPVSLRDPPYQSSMFSVITSQPVTYSVSFQLIDTALCKNLITTLSRSISFCLNVSLIWIQAKNFKMEFEILSVAGCYRASDFRITFQIFFSSSHLPIGCSLNTVSKMQPFLSISTFVQTFVLLWFNCCNILLSDLCKFNIPLLSSRLSSYFKVNFLPCHFSCIILL